MAFSRNPFLVGFSGTLIALLMITLSLTSLNQGRSEAFKHATETSANLVSIITNDISRNVELYNLSLQAIVDGATDPRVMALPADLRRQVLFDRATAASHLGGAYLLDSTGHIVAQSEERITSSRRFNDLDYFTAHESGSAVGLFISKPFDSGLHDGTKTIGLSRRIDAPDGSFAGVAVLAVNVDYFRSILSKIDTGLNGSTFVVTIDGSLLARKPFVDDKVANIARSSTFGKMISQSDGSYEAVAAVDGVRRLYTFARVTGTPFIVAVAPAQQDILADWRKQSGLVGGLGAVLCFAFIAMSWLLAYSLRERAKTQAELSRLAETDGLTGLSNRRAFDNAVDHEWKRTKRDGNYLSLLFIDVDNFKAYNDIYGHGLGDQALASIADCMRAVLRRPSDIPARYGGEEFVILLPNTPGGGALKVAELLRETVQRMAVEHKGHPFGVLTVSIGVATCRPQAGGDALDLVTKADEALYLAKGAGRNRVESFN